MLMSSQKKKVWCVWGGGVNPQQTDRGPSPHLTSALFKRLSEETETAAPVQLTRGDEESRDAV